MLHVFRERPRWATAMLGALLVISALLFTWNIGYSGVSTYYAASAVSMSRSWHALFYGALDPNATITLDKLSGFLVPQAASVSLFGVHAWALSLPQVVEGLVTLLAVYAIGMRWRGPVVAVAAAAVVTFTPMLAAMFGRPMEDGMLTMTTALAVLAAQRAALSGHGAWLLLAALWVGVGFQAKMLQSWFIVPAVLLIFLLGASTPWRHRIGWAALGAGASVAASISWIAMMQLTPPALRPYSDGTTDDSPFAMVFGYNGVDRIVPGLLPGSVPQLDASGGGQTGAPLPLRVADAGHSLAKLALPQITTQIGWLDVVVLVGIVVELALLVPVLRRRLPAAMTALLPRNAIDRGMAAGLIAWVAVTALILTPAFVPHATYFAPMAPALALLAAAGAVDAVRMMQARIPGWRRLAPAAALAGAAWQVSIIALGPRALVWVAAPVALLGVLAALGLWAVGSGPLERRRVLAATGVAAVAALLAPALWSSCVIFPGGGGSASDAYAGPRDTAIIAHSHGTVARTTGRAPVRRATRSAPAPSLRPPFAADGDLRLTARQRQLVDYTRARVGRGRPLFATDTLAIAVSVILTTHDGAMPMGGFSRQAPTPTPTRLRQDIGTGELRFVLLADPRTPQPPNAVLARDRAWVRTACRPVMHGRFRADSPQSQTLYDCASAIG